MQAVAEEWKVYPTNLSATICNTWVHDLQAYQKEFVADSDQLFVKDDRLHIKAVEIGGSSQYS